MKLVRDGEVPDSSRIIRGENNEEVRAVTMPTDDELDELFSFDDDPEFLEECEWGRAELQTFILRHAAPTNVAPSRAIVVEPQEDPDSASNSRTLRVVGPASRSPVAAVSNRTRALVLVGLGMVIAAAAALIAIAATPQLRDPGGDGRYQEAMGSVPLSDRFLLMVSTVGGSRPSYGSIEDALASADSYGYGQVDVVTTDGSIIGSYPIGRSGSVPQDEVIRDSSSKITADLAELDADTDGLDLLTALADATKGDGTGRLVVLSSGLSDSGELDLAEVGWDADPRQLALDLKERGALPDLVGWNVTFDLSEPGLRTQELSDDQVRTLAQYWREVLDYSDALAVTVDAGLAVLAAETAPAPVSSADLAGPPISLSIDGRIRFESRLSVGVDGFEADSAQLNFAMRERIEQLAAALASSDHVVFIVGSVREGGEADPYMLAQARAQAVADVLIENGLPARRLLAVSVHPPGSEIEWSVSRNQVDIVLQGWHR